MADASAYVTSLSLVGLLGPGPPPYPDAPETVTSDGWSLSWADVSSVNTNVIIPPVVPIEGGGGGWIQPLRPRAPQPPAPLESPPVRPKIPVRAASGAASGRRQESIGHAYVEVRGRGAASQRGAVLIATGRVSVRVSGAPRQYTPVLATHGSVLARGVGSPWHWGHFVSGKARSLASARGLAVAGRAAALGTASVNWAAVIAAEDALIEAEEVSIFSDVA